MPTPPLAVLFDIDDSSLLVPVLGVGYLLAAFLINLSANRLIQGISTVLSFIKIGGIVLFGVVGVLAADSMEVNFSAAAPGASMTEFLGATALGILAFKGFTSITNSGSELKDPRRNLGKAIMISIGLCVGIYALVGFAVSSNLSLEEIIATRNYSMAAAARPALGEYAVLFTVILAMLATAGSIQKHTLVYTVVLGLLLTAFFDLSRIAALGILKELFTPLFAMARIAGWSAHRLEELANNGKIIRPAYKSVADRRPYVPMAER